MGLFGNKQEQQTESTLDREREDNMIMTGLQTGTQEQAFQEELAKERADLIRWQQDLTPEAIAYINEIRGEVFNPESGKYELSNTIKPLANIKFIRRIKPLLRLATSRNLMMTSYSEERVRRSLSRAASQYANLIYFYHKDFEIDKRDFSYLVSSYQQLIEPTHYRSLNNGERNYLTSSTRRLETVSGNPQEQKKGLFNLGS